ncbi:MAG: hypothetical protein ACRDJH_01165 [Thermomicrobiales bacterium]
MRSSLERAIRERLAEYLDGERQLDDFKDWLVGATWNVEQSKEPAAVDLTYEIKLLLAEHSGGYLTENELRTEFALVAKLNQALARTGTR